MKNKKSLHLADNLAGPSQRFHHLLALFPSAYRVVALLEEVVQVARLVELFQQLALDFVFAVSTHC